MAHASRIPQRTYGEILVTLEQFKLVTISPEFTNGEVEKIFLDLEIVSEDDLQKVVDIIVAHRPKILEKLNSDFARSISAAP